eukprot:CAMPEP_0113534540 /NCGR_PEP_ID=MMETSP0015_2-20120614/5212_1 /TAXON_ID=2838 /ORGANISM="Odontella" /LENGTH=907 /DNA_ID=CAMNT_0000433705 /DNA_START=185 /DNA_END=2908 /DNA_ORIENTATION=- /assembly_acc=CAM_ASM_000160
MKKGHRWTFASFFAFLVFDALSSAILLTPLLPGLQIIEDADERPSHYTLHGSFFDLAVLAVLRICSAVYAVVCYYHQDKPPLSPFDEFHPSGERKTREQLDEEALEEPCFGRIKRYSSRYAFPCEMLSVITSCLVIVKCLARLDVEIGVFDDAKPTHPVFWTVLCVSSLASVIECLSIEHVGLLLGRYGRLKRRSRSLVRNSSSAEFLNEPLISAQMADGDRNCSRDEESQLEGDTNGDENELGDVWGDKSSECHKAGWTDLKNLLKPDVHLIVLAFVFLLLAAAAQVYIPKYTGNILDALGHAYGDNKEQRGGDIWDIPDFMPNIEKLVLASIFAGLFAGIRGSIFTLVGGRVNVRMRVLLMDSLLCQEVGFFDVTKTGDITSRLSSDTTLVGDQVTLNVNVFLRSFVQAVGVLIFMFTISWKLSLLAFISVPAITILSKWYGHYVKSLTKIMQKKLADGNAVSEAAIGSMSTVRAFGAESAELKEFEESMQKYLALNVKSSVVYVGYMFFYCSLPQLVIALVLFYGGLLVRSTGQDHISAGQLVSFLLYLSSLSDAFNSIGYIFASLTAAVGAADKVFELMKRAPRISSPSTQMGDEEEPGMHEQEQKGRGIVGITAKRVHAAAKTGLSPAQCAGKISLRDVDMVYPARPQTRVLRGMTMVAPPGKVVALVGPSGGGKSSIVSLLQHLYEPISGGVCIDDIKVQDLSPEWISRHVSVVSQEPTLFARSIRRNIIYGLEGMPSEPTMEEIKEAARLANAASFIEALPLGYDTDVGERGVQLSGGQKQRLCICRALVRKPRILLLDEATSALDAESEALVQEAIDEMLLRGREDQGGFCAPMTVVIIAHRLSTVRNADIIYVIESGRVVESGSHSDLIKNGDGTYAKLIKRQVKAECISKETEKEML